MIRNYIKTAFRNLIKNKTYAFINILGLAIGLASSIMILLYLKNELTFDRMHVNKKSIYRVAFASTGPNGTESYARVTPGPAPSLLEEFPEVELSVRVRQPLNGYFVYKDLNYEAKEVSFVDSSFFKMFSFKLLSGTPGAVLADPYSIVLSESLATKIFGDDDPVGKVINWKGTYSVVVKGIVEDCPENSSVRYSALISFTTLYDLPRMYMDWNGGNQYFNFIKLHDNSSLETILPSMPDFMERHVNHRTRKYGYLTDLVFTRLDLMHLYSTLDHDYSAGDLKQMYTVSIIGLFILFIAIFNFINLSTAKSSKRSVEIGIRKVLGAHRQKISSQFLGEAVFYSLISLVVSLIIVEVFQPVFINYLGNYNLYSKSNIGFLGVLILFTVGVGLIAGIYPAIYIARFNPIKILKGHLISVKGKPYLRNTLVVLQFFISAAIITYTVVMLLQIDFMQNKNLGIKTENTLIVRMPSHNAIQDYKIIKSHLEDVAEVESIGGSSQIVGIEMTRNGYFFEGMESPKMFKYLGTDHNLLDMLDVQIVRGEGFSEESGTDAEAFLVNEALVKEMNWANPIGQKIMRNGSHNVIGVVKDFHYERMTEKIAPLIIGLNGKHDNEYMAIKLYGEINQSKTDKIEAKWREIFPEEPFNFYIYESVLTRSYGGLHKSSFVFGVFAFIAILVACMGLYGLAMFKVEKQQREIGIRKVFGAEISQIGKLVVLDFLKWILIANIISIPIAYYYAEKFLQTFPYTIKLNALPFVTTLLVSLVIAVITIGFQVLKLTRVNPVDTLKYE